MFYSKAKLFSFRSRFLSGHHRDNQLRFDARHSNLETIGARAKTIEIWLIRKRQPKSWGVIARDEMRDDRGLSIIWTLNKFIKSLIHKRSMNDDEEMINQIELAFAWQSRFLLNGSFDYQQPTRMDIRWQWLDGKRTQWNWAETCTLDDQKQCLESFNFQWNSQTNNWLFAFGKVCEILISNTRP